MGLGWKGERGRGKGGGVFGVDGRVEPHLSHPPPSLPPKPTSALHIQSTLTLALHPGMAHTTQALSTLVTEMRTQSGHRPDPVCMPPECIPTLVYLPVPPLHPECIPTLVYLPVPPLHQECKV